MIEYKTRRAKLYELFPNAVIILKAPSKVNRTADTHYEYRPDSYFFYITGCDEPQTIAVLDCRARKTTLYIPTSTSIWEKNPTFSKIKEQTGVDAVLDKTKFKKPQGAIVYSLPWLGKYGRSKELLFELTKMRLSKSKHEIGLIHYACTQSYKEFKKIQTLAKIRTPEQSIRECFNKFPTAYQPICTVEGSVLHNERYENEIKGKDVLLVDAGYEYRYYASDITRSYVVGNNAFMKELVKSVKQVKTQLLEYVKPGVTMLQLHKRAIKLLMDELVRIKVLTESSNYVEKKVMPLLMPHGIGHHLGLDVHDCSQARQLPKKLLKELTPLPVNAVITIEPGIYFHPENMKKIDISKINMNVVQLGKGVRVEDTVLVTRIGGQILGNS